MAFDVARIVTRALNRGDDELMEQAMRVRALPSPGPDGWWADRLGLLATTLITPLKMRFHHSRSLASDVVAYDVSMLESQRDRRRFFVRHHFREEIDFVGRGEDRRVRQPGSWMRWYAVGIGVALLAFADFSGRRYRWLGGLLLDVEAFARAASGIRRAYFFALYDRRPYLLATFLARHTDVEVVLVFQNIPLYRNCRYLHLDVPVVLTSKVNIPEVRYFQEQGIFRSSHTTYASGEYVADTIGLEPGEPICDIGYFSSGEWARREGLYQSSDVVAVSSGAFAENEYAIVADHIVSVLARYAHAHGRTLRIYPHPFERALMFEHGIEPPYARLANGGDVTVDWDGKHSRGKIYDARVAVSLQSSFIWERLDLGLSASFIYEFADPQRNAFLAESLGPYRANVFRDDEDLMCKVGAALDD